MAFLSIVFFWSLLIAAVYAESTNVSKQPNQNSTKDNGASASEAAMKCHNVYTYNSFNAGPNKKIESLLYEMKQQLIDVQQEIKCLKGNQTKPGYKKNCAELYESGERISGVYTIEPDDSAPFDVFCDQTTADGGVAGGWTVLQKRLDGSVDFYRGWEDYKRGFGNLNGEFWLGLDKINLLTKNERNRLRVELEDIEGNTAYADYDMFSVSSESTYYQMGLGTYHGTAGDSLGYHRGSRFSTKDQDNDNNSDGNCAVGSKGGWWFNRCVTACLNCLYHHGPHSSDHDGVNWRQWKGRNYSAKRAEMKIRPVNF